MTITGVRICKTVGRFLLCTSTKVKLVRVHRGGALDTETVVDPFQPDRYRFLTLFVTPTVRLAGPPLTYGSESLL